MIEGYKPLTPSLRAKIDKGFDDMISELKTCKPNALVIAQVNALNTYKKLIHGLPDGYPMPIKK